MFKGKFTKGVELSKEERPMKCEQGVAERQTTRHRETFPAPKTDTGHDDQESDGTRFRTNQQYSNKPINHLKWNTVSTEIFFYIFLSGGTGLKSDHDIPQSGRHFEVANILEVHSPVPGV